MMKIIWLFLVWVVGMNSFNAQADSELSTDQIRGLVKQGKVLSLDAILKKNSLGIAGRFLDLEVSYEEGRIIYELEFLKENGEVMEYVINAENGRLLKQEIDN